jgi:tRNA pseudouridine55 synthase
MSTDGTKAFSKKPHHHGRRTHSKHKTAPVDAVSGVLLVDKPQGVTSFGVVEEVRRLLGVRRVGHCGTLDPLATGLLVILIGECTKVAQYLTDEDKAYEGQIRLGQETDTDDSEGKVLEERDASAVTLAQAEAHAQKFLGTISQKPPRFSAQKRQGVRAYERARAGEDFEPEARDVVVHEIMLRRYEGGLLDFTCRVGKGTYVRSLARDLGAALGVGGHVSNLRRTYSGGFSLQNALTLPELEAMTLEERRARVHTLAQAWAPRPVISLSTEDTARVRRGQQASLDKDAVTAPEGAAATALAICGTQPIAVGRLEWDRITRMYVFAPERNLFVG